MAEDQPRIYDRCPSCGERALFIGAGGWLTCSRLQCDEPGVTAWREKIESDLAQAVAERNRMRAALETYGRHLSGCPARPDYERLCTCGLREALLPPTTSEEKS